MFDSTPGNPSYSRHLSFYSAGRWRLSCRFSGSLDFASAWVWCVFFAWSFSAHGCGVWSARWPASAAVFRSLGTGPMSRPTGNLPAGRAIEKRAFLNWPWNSEDRLAPPFPSRQQAMGTASSLPRRARLWHRTYKKSIAISVSSWNPYTESEILKGITYPFERAGAVCAWPARSVFLFWRLLLDEAIGRRSILVRLTGTAA